MNKKFTLDQLQSKFQSDLIDMDLDEPYLLFSRQGWQSGATENLVYHSLKQIFYGERIVIVGAGLYNDHRNQFKNVFLRIAHSLGLQENIDFEMTNFKYFKRKEWVKKKLPLLLVATYKDYKEWQAFTRHFVHKNFPKELVCIWDEFHTLFFDTAKMEDTLDGTLGDIQALVEDLILRQKIRQHIFCSATSLNVRFKSISDNIGVHKYEPGQHYVHAENLIWKLKEDFSSFTEGFFDQQDQEWLLEIPARNIEHNIALVTTDTYCLDKRNVTSNYKHQGMLQLAHSIKKFRESKGIFGSYYATYSGDGLKIIGETEDHYMYESNGEFRSLTTRLDEFNNKFGTEAMLFIVSDKMVNCGLNIHDSQKTRRIYCQFLDRSVKDESNFHRLRANIYSETFIPILYSTYTFKRALLSYVDKQDTIMEKVVSDGYSLNEAFEQIALDPKFFKPKLTKGHDFIKAGYGEDKEIEYESITTLVKDQYYYPLLERAMKIYNDIEDHRTCPIVVGELADSIVIAEYGAQYGFNSKTKLRAYVEKEVKRLAMTELSPRMEPRLRGVFEQEFDKPIQKRGNHVQQRVNRNFYQKGLDDGRTINYWWNDKQDKPYIRVVLTDTFLSPYIVQHNFSGELECFVKESGGNREIKVKNGTLQKRCDSVTS